jgi:hypothetical protein
MEQRPLRLGDLVDDYCPRERRITNHAIVAIVDDAIRQTRCTTCDAEHVYKQAKVPRRRRPEATVYEQVLSDVSGGQAPPLRPRVADGPRDDAAGPGASASENVSDEEPRAAAATDGGAADPDDAVEQSRTHETWSGHRPLIRATLPRTEGEPPPPRPIPEFTMHQRQTHGSRAFRHGQGWSGAGAHQDRNGNRPDARERGGHGHPQGHGHGGPRPHGKGGGRHGRHRGPGKRSR